jgi:citronellol/citronellal dehydrogenase
LNNASAINLSGTLQLPMKTYDLMQDINTRGTYLVSRTCLPHLVKADNPHILSLSPPLNMSPHWFANNLGYTIAKYGMSMCTLGMSAEFAAAGVAVNSLWPRTAIATAAVQNLLGGDESMRLTRSPEIMADAAYEIFTRPSREATGNFYVDDEVLAAAGVTDLSGYSMTPDADLMPDFFLDG